MADLPDNQLHRRMPEPSRGSGSAVGDRYKRFVWEEGDIVILPKTEACWDYSYRTGHSIILAGTLDGLIQSILQKDPDADLETELRRIIDSPKAANMPLGLRRELIEWGFITFTVPGSPALLTASKQIADTWKEKVAAHVRSAWCKDYNITEPCALTLVAHLPPATYASTALHNVLKSTLDGFGSVAFAPSPGTKLSQWHTEDWRIVELVASKCVAEQEAKVELGIQLHSHGSVMPDNSDTLIAEVRVPGSPPVWASNAQKERAWRERVDAALQDKAPLDLATQLRIECTFVIEAARMESADLDNFCVPAAYAIGTSLFGRKLPPQNIVEMHATKRTVVEDEEPYTRLRIWRR